MTSTAVKVGLTLSMVAVMAFYCLLVVRLPTVYVDNRNEHKLILVILDGFGQTQLRELQRSIDKNSFYRIAANGISAEYMRPIFPTLTQPNHYALMTGLYAEDHGVVHDVLYNATSKQEYKFHENPQMWFRNVEPVWLTFSKSGKNVMLRTSRCHSVPVLNITANCKEKLSPLQHLTMFDKNLKESLHRVAHEDVDLAIVHTPLVHKAIHEGDTVSTKTSDIVEQLDKVLSQFLDNIDPLESMPNVMVVSDVGLAPITNKKPVMLLDDVDADDIDELIEGGALINIWPREGADKKVLDSVRNVVGIRVFTKDDQTFSKFHYKRNDMIAPIQVVTEDGYYPICNLKKNFSKPKSLHGYDPYRVDDMKVIFFAQGPQFELGKKVPFIQTTEVYAIIRRVLLIDRPSDDPRDGVIKKNPLHPKHH